MRSRTEVDPASVEIDLQGDTVVVIPCYNEADRLDLAAFKELAMADGVHLLFVNDGSIDTTDAILLALADAAENIDVLTLPSNRGKAEAVRRGLSAACRADALFVGYLDADLATSPDDFLTLLGAIRADGDLLGVLGARVQLLGHRIERKPLRHYCGRVFASFAALALGMRVYDTQCGAKVFRTGPELDRAIDRPFRSPWFFDVELLLRLSQASDSLGARSDRFLEVPLQAWRDVHGSRITPITAAEAAFALVSITYRRMRSQARRVTTTERP